MGTGCRAPGPCRDAAHEGINLGELETVQRITYLLIKDLDAGELRTAIEQDMKEIEDRIKHPSLAKRLKIWWTKFRQFC